jgi:polysaccharide pyruvyl transferase CsaB
MPGKVLIGGYYGYGNAGDEAILAAMLGELSALRPDLELTVASGDPERTRAEHGARAVAAADLVALSAAVEASDLVVLGGGGLFQDYWDVPAETLLTARQGGLLSYLVYPVLAALHNRPAVIYAAGVGPLATEQGRSLTRVAFELCRRATVRDAPSLALLAEIGLRSPAVELAADPAFLLPAPPEGETAALLAELGAGAGEALTGVALRHWDFGVEPGVWEAEVARGLDLYLAEFSGRLLFLPFQSEGGERYEDDLAVNRRVAGALATPERAVVVERRLRPEELAGLLGRCQRVLAMRFHSALFALAAGVPAACLAYDPKVTALMADAGLPELALPPALWQGDTVAEALRGAARPGLRERLAGFARERRALARRSAEVALETLDEGPADRPEARRFLDELALAKAGSVVRLEAEGEELRQRLQAGESEGQDLQRLLRAGEAEREDLQRLLHASEAELGANRLRLEVNENRLRVRESELWMREAELTESRRLLAAREVELGGLRQDWEARGRKLEDSWAAHRGMRDQRDIMLRERNDLARRLGAMEATVAYGLLSRFWALMRRLFPEGSRRRAVYRGGRGFLRRLLGLRLPAAPGLPLLEEAPGGIGEHDPRGDLLRFEERARESGAERVVAILSATQLLESEGQRPTQLALELARRGIPVVFCYWRWWPHEWCVQDRLDEGIVQIPIDVAVAVPEMLAGAFAGRPSRIALFSFPYPGFFELLAAFNAEGWITVYDVLDDWQEFHRVGQAVWYDEPFERHLIGAADAVFAINEPLAGRIRELGGEGVEVVGNGLKPGLERVREPHPLDRGEVTVGYFGYLAGAWFDWQLVAGAARLRPSWRFYLIGYGGSPEDVELPANVLLLGKQPQGDLAAYAANWDVAMIPFKPDRLAAGADPIKTYEYLAMGLPVVAAGVYPPAGGEAFVTRAEGIGAFLDALAAAAAAEGPERAAARRAFAATCSWGCRLDALLGAVDRGGQRVAEKRALAGAGPATPEMPETAP